MKGLPRTVQKIGDSLYLCLPSDILRELKDDYNFDIEPGTSLRLDVNKDGEIIVSDMS